MTIGSGAGTVETVQHTLGFFSTVPAEMIGLSYVTLIVRWQLHKPFCLDLFGLRMLSLAAGWDGVDSLLWEQITLLAYLAYQGFWTRYYLKFFPFVPTSCHLCSHSVTFSQLLQAMDQGSIFLHG